MTQRNPSKITEFIESIGLDWLPIIFNESLFPSYPKPTADRRNEVQQRISDIDSETLEELVENFRKQLEWEDQRRGQIEGKATYLLGFTAVTLSFIVGFAQFLLAEELLPPLLRWIAVCLYLLIASSLLVTVILARKAVTVRAYQIPVPSDFLNLRKSNRTFFLRGLATDLLCSYEFNHAVVNDKTSYILGAEDWFRNTICSLIMLMAIMASGIAIAPSQKVREPVQPLQMVILTPTPTDLPTPTPTSTMTPTPLPSATPTPFSTVTPVSPSVPTP